MSTVKLSSEVRLNHDTKPSVPVPEGYEYLWGTKGWRLCKLLSTEEKQARSNAMRAGKQQAKAAKTVVNPIVTKRVEPAPEDDIREVLKEVKALREKLLKPEPEPKPVAPIVVKTSEPSKPEVKPEPV